MALNAPAVILFASAPPRAALRLVLTRWHPVPDARAEPRPGYTVDQCPYSCLTDAELRYLRKLSQDNLEVMEFMAKQKALELPDRKVAHQLKAKFDSLLATDEKGHKKG